MSNNAYLIFLFMGVLFVAIDGQILYRGSRRYLGNSPGAAASESSMGRMVTVVFHLVCFGLLALISLIDLGGSTIAAVVGRLGIFLLLMALAHAFTLSVLSRQRQNQVLEERVQQAHHGPSPRTSAVQDARYSDMPVDPVPGQPGVPPQVSPDLDQHGPYST